jgi:hypothetical protein
MEFTKEELEQEVWKDCVDYEGSYQISSLGRVRSLDRDLVKSKGVSTKLKGQLLKPSYCKDNYCYVTFKGIKQKVHRLVAKAFIPNHENKPTVNHKDEVRDNNRVGNLEWMTVEEQNKYSKGINVKVFHEGQIKSYPSILECANELGVDSSSIVTLSKEYTQLMKTCKNILINNSFIYKTYETVEKLEDCKGINLKGDKFYVRVTISPKNRVFVGSYSTLEEAVNSRNTFIIQNNINTPIYNLNDDRTLLKDDIMSGLHVLNNMEHLDDITKQCVFNLLLKFQKFIE